MDELTLVLIIGGIVFTTFAVEGIAGFGSTVMALPFVAMLIGVEKAVPLLSSMGLLLSFFIVCRSYRKLDLREYGFIVLHAAPGVAAGLFLTDFLPRNVLIALLVCFIFFVGIRGLVCFFRSPEGISASDGKNPHTLSARGVLLLGGVIQGAFSSGGPVVVMYASKAIPEKSRFRAVLSSLWLTTNSIMALKWTVAGNVWTPFLGRMILCLLPFVVCGMVTGDFLHHKVDQRKFTLLVYSVLIVAGVMLGTNLARSLLS